MIYVSSYRRRQESKQERETFWGDSMNTNLKHRAEFSLPFLMLVVLKNVIDAKLLTLRREVNLLGSVNVYKKTPKLNLQHSLTNFFVTEKSSKTSSSPKSKDKGLLLSSVQLKFHLVLSQVFKWENLANEQSLLRVWQRNARVNPILCV